MKISQERNDPEEGFCLPSAKGNWSENCSQASCMDAAQWWASHCKARSLDVQIWRRVRWHQGFPLITRALHTLLIQIKGIHIRFHISLIILYMVLHVHLGSELHPYISSFLWSLLLHLLFWNISNYLGAQLFVMWSLSLRWEGIFRKKKKKICHDDDDVICWFQKDLTIYAHWDIKWFPYFQTLKESFFQIF